MIQLVLKIFHKLSGLRVNLQKSELLVTSMHFCQVSRLAQLIECKPIEFPLIYLGLSLSNKAITKGYYQKLIDSIQNRLPGCYASKLSMAGRIVILNSVISAITMYHMTVFMLPEWVIKAIDRIRRQFLWHGHKEYQVGKRAMCLVNWKVVTMKKEDGGLGIRDIKAMNFALIAKWMWMWLTQEKWWKEATMKVNEAYRPWEDYCASRFWQNIAKVKTVFNCSISFQLGNGKKILFWNDNWKDDIMLNKYPMVYRNATNQRCTVKEFCEIEAVNIRIESTTSSSEKALQVCNLRREVQEVFLQEQTDDLIQWNRHSQGFS
jgi:hypothetical protein